MEPSPRKIEIFAPFEAAFDLTKQILFRPFDLGKWCVIGFAAFLANLTGNFGNAFNYNSYGDKEWKFRSTTSNALEAADGLPGWAIALIVAAVIVLVVIVVAVMWVSARGKFIFTDCIVHNRAAIVAPWKEFKREGNSYFLFSLAVAVILLAVLGLASMPIWWGMALGGNAPDGIQLALSLVGFGVIALVVCCGWALLAGFMIPIMYRRRCGAGEGFRGAVTMLTTHPGPVILFALFSIVLWVAIALMACVITCLTCCITAIPYVGTVILLPVYVFFASYVLLFARQFGNEYDAWGNVPVADPAPDPTPPPPVEPPPTAPPPLPA